MMTPHYCVVLLVLSVACLTRISAAGNTLYSSVPTLSSSPPVASGSVTCLSAEDAAVIGRDFGLLISNYTRELAVKLLADEFIDQSDSVITLINSSPLPHQDLGSLTFDSKAAFLEGQGAQPPVPFDILNTWHTCDTVIIRWRSPQEPDQVQGISIGVARPVDREEEAQGLGVGGVSEEGIKWVLKAVYAEFNSGAWLKNLGNPECESVE